LREDLNEKFGYWAELIESSGGVFEVTVNGDLIFSKKSLDRFPEDNEIINLVERFGLI
jgi:selenoprotein W-related protein